MPEIDERILMWRGGHLLPRVAQEPLISSAANKWGGVRLERHHLYGPSESNGVIDGFQICCTLSGPVSVEWLVHGSWQGATLNKGDLCLAAHGEFRSVAWHSTYDLLLVSILPQLVAEVNADAREVRPVEVTPQRAFRDLNVESICRLLLADTAAGTPIGPLYGEHLASALAVYLAEQFGELPPHSRARENCLPGPVLKRVCELIETRLGTPLGLQDLAREANMSRFHFSRLFHNSTGESPHRFVVKRRIERAKEMLARGCSDEEVINAGGFANRSHFASLFRRYVGVTPRKFRSLF